jgi:hexosaminidase
MKSTLSNRPLAFLSLTFVALLSGCTEQNSKNSVAHTPVVSEIAEIENSAQTLVESAAQNIDITVRVDNNYLSEGCPADAQSCYKATMKLTLAANMPENWRILFSNLSPVSHAVSRELTLRHMNGDLHEITAKTGALASDIAYSITFYGNTPLVSESVLFPNYLLVDGQGNTHVITSTTERLSDGHQLPRPQHVLAFTDSQQSLRKADDKVAIANATERYHRFNARAAALSTGESNRIIPRIENPEWTSERIDVSAGLHIPALTQINDKVDNAYANNMLAAIVQRFSDNGLPLSKGGVEVDLVHIEDSDSHNLNEGYRLDINKNNISITYHSIPGLYYAMMSLAQLYDEDSTSLPIGTAQDTPHLAFRGLHIDVSRNFRSKDFILKVLDQMGYYKLNKLHLHLADDEGWRLQIATLPELTNVGAFRCFDENEQRCLLPQLAGGDGKLPASEQNSGYYSIEDYIEILHYAQARQIEVLPSLDMPGHSRAAIVSMNARYNRLMLEEKPDEAERFFLTELADTSEYRSIQHYNDNTLNPCIPATYRFVEEVLGELKRMHESAGVPLQRYHIGADETAGAWTDSPACANFIAENDDITEVRQLGPYFIERVANKVSELGVIPAAWSDGMSYANPANLPPQVQANAWETLYSGGHNKAHKMVNKGWDVVLSTPDVLYFDFPYEADPIEPGYYWGSRYTDSYQVFQFMPLNLPAHAEIWYDNFGHPYSAKAEINMEPKRSILGIQAQLWSETVRSDAQANYMLFPRLLVVAERAWHHADWAEAYQSNTDYSQETSHIDAKQIALMKQDWQHFSQVLSHNAMPQLIRAGIEPRVPLPGAIIKEGHLHMHPTYQGLQLEYALESDQDDWQVYQGPVALSEQNTKVKVRAKVTDTKVFSREQQIQAGGQ